MTHRRQIVIGSAAWLIAASAGAATKRAKGAGAKKVALVDDGAPDVVTYGLRDDVVRFAEGVAERRELDVEWVQKCARAGALHPGRDALHHAADDRDGEELGRLPRPLRRADPHPRRRRLLARQPALARPGRGPVRRAARDRRRHRRRRVDLRPADGRLPRHRRAGDAGVRFPERPQGPQRLLPGRARGLVRPLQERRHRSARLARQLRRRARHGAVHAVELQQVRGRLRRRRPRRPARATPPT